MKSFILFFTFYIFFLVSCSSDIDSKINGQWQLKTIENSDLSVSIDTVFYSFQRGSIFSFTVLKPDEFIESVVSYGYVYFPNQKELHIQMDTSKRENGTYQNIHTDFLKDSQWKEYKNTFTIQHLDNKSLVLHDKENVYYLKKY